MAEYSPMLPPPPPADFLLSKYQLWVELPFRYLRPRVDIYFVKCQQVIPGPLPPKKSAKFAL